MTTLSPGFSPPPRATSRIKETQLTNPCCISSSPGMPSPRGLMAPAAINTASKSLTISSNLILSPTGVFSLISIPMPSIAAISTLRMSPGIRYAGIPKAIIPPGSDRASNTVTPSPSRARSAAQVSPAGPAPITAILPCFSRGPLYRGIIPRFNS